MWKALCVCRENLTQWEQIVQGEDTSAWASAEEAELGETSDSGPVKVDNWICGTCPTAPPTPCQRRWTSCGQSHFLQRQEEAQRAGGEGYVQKNKQNITLPRWVTKAYMLMTSGLPCWWLGLKSTSAERPSSLAVLLLRRFLLHLFL